MGIDIKVPTLGESVSSLVINDSELTNNYAGNSANGGGGVALFGAGVLAIARTTIDNNTLVTDPVMSASYFPGFDFSQPPATAFSANGRTQIINSLLNNVLGTTPLSTNPDPNAVTNELNALITKLTACGGNCPAGRTQTVVEATCAALAGSAATLVE